LTTDAVVAVIESMEKEANTIKQDCVKMVWHMRGGVTYQEIMLMDHADRQRISALVKENLETTKKTQLPYF
jgi:hypothetical protein